MAEAQISSCAYAFSPCFALWNSGDLRDKVLPEVIV